MKGHVAQADMPDLAGLLQLRQGTHLFSQREGRVRPVQLEQVDRLHAQPPLACLACGFQLVRPPSTIFSPCAETRTPPFVATVRPGG